MSKPNKSLYLPQTDFLPLLRIMTAIAGHTFQEERPLQATELGILCLLKSIGWVALDYDEDDDEQNEMKWYLTVEGGKSFSKLLGDLRKWQPFEAGKKRGLMSSEEYYHI